MTQTALRSLLEQVASGQATVEQAMTQLKTEPFEDLGFALCCSGNGAEGKETGDHCQAEDDA